MTIGLFCWLFLRVARENEERQKLLDYAIEHGIALDERRAQRAVAAGRGDELWARLRRSEGDPVAGGTPGSPPVGYLTVRVPTMPAWRWPGTEQ